MTLEEFMEEFDRAEGEIEKPILIRLQQFVDSKFSRRKLNAKLTARRGSATHDNTRGHVFLTDLLRNALYLTHHFAHEIAWDQGTPSDGEVLPEGANIIANFLVKVLNECLALKASPERFPSSSAREAFLTKIEAFCSSLEILEEIVEQKLSASWHIHNTDLHLIEEISIPEADPAKIRSLLRATKPPIFHPDRRDAKNPWNNWLDNSAAPVPDWIAIQQKIPRVGDLMNRKKVHEYDILEADVDEVSS
jgi:hypothetical protein